ncbi:D-Ala-D-Ala carboxypeptidase family metallohydrolase [Lysobacter brunescens]|uniref:D-Ala-D-Ala carboxypeptidase family metallohydrolase n=1 Tax=Lysobacter brunescens TaxID=262323 RepID=A0ABW2YE24_9GAMM
MSQRAPAKPRFNAWADAGHREQVASYRAHLERQGLADVMPMDALLKTSRRWRLCLDDEFATPPPALQPNIAPTLHVVARLHSAGLLDPAQARSGWRDARVNRCAGGASGSKHLQNNAIDFDLPERPGSVTALCAWWRTHGKKARMGLGFYTPTAIHIDTSGFRTWGNDRTRCSSLCVTRD